MKFRLLLVGLLWCHVAFAQNLPSYVPSAGLMGWWPFNGNCLDESGNNYHGINTNAILTPDRFGIPDAAYRFDGTGYIQIPNLNFQSGWSVGFWMKPDSVNTNLQFVIGLDCFSNFPTIGVSSLSGVCGMPDYNLFLFDGVGTCNNLYYGGSYLNEQNTHVVYTKNQSIYRCYINGQLSATDTALGPLVFVTSLYFGTRCGFLSDPFGGTLDDIGVWSRALDSTEVRVLYESCSKSLLQDVVDQTASTGSTAFFTVSSAIPTADFQWQVNTGTGFQSLNNGGQYSGVTDDTLYIANVGTSNNQGLYRCLVSWGACVDTSSAGILTVNNSTGVASPAAFDEITVYPSPVVNTLFLKIASSVSVHHYRIIGLTGNSILEGDISGEVTSVDLEAVPAGTYWVELDNGSHHSFSIVK